jgi:hypothetical protein
LNYSTKLLGGAAGFNSSLDGRRARSSHAEIANERSVKVRRADCDANFVFEKPKDNFAYLGARPSCGRHLESRRSHHCKLVGDSSNTATRRANKFR